MHSFLKRESKMDTLVFLALLVAPALGRGVEPVPALITSKDSYIIGGSDVDIDSYPHQGSLQFTSGSHTCGVVRVSAVWIVTAAHCVGNSASSYQMRFGSSNRSSGGQLVGVRFITRHPNYSGSGAEGFPNDIAVIRSTVTILAGNPIVMASSGDFAGQICTITGWGRIQTGGAGELPEVLQGVNITVLSHDECSSRWSQVNANYHICVGGTNGPGSCNGDSGGPLTCGSVLAGLTSWGISGCYTNYPSVYTRVSTYRPWVHLITGRRL